MPQRHIWERHILIPYAHIFFEKIASSFYLSKVLESVGNFSLPWTCVYYYYLTYFLIMFIPFTYDTQNTFLSGHLTDI